LCELEELSYQEAAQLSGCPIGTIRSRLHRGRALLMAKLEILRDAPRRVKAAQGEREKEVRHEVRGI
jgi:DNA-directed RNA polymerase specialized sigma24 family protein